MKVDLWIVISLLKSLELLWGFIRKKCTEKSFFFELNGLLQASELIGGSKMIDKFDFPFVFIE
jgi:hypothetical protein